MATPRGHPAEVPAREEIPLPFSDLESMDFPLTDAQTAQFHQDGYLVFPGFFDDRETAACKAAMDELQAIRERNERVLFAGDVGALGPLISHPRVLAVVEQVMGPGFAFHHLHASRQDAGTRGVRWHQDYEQEPQTNRSHIMVHVFYYFNGLNGEVGDLVFLPGSQKTVVANSALGLLGENVLPGEVVVDSLPPGSAVLVHSALWHARRARPGGQDRPRYFADASYCQAGIRWPSYGKTGWQAILQRCVALGLDRDGTRAHLFDEAHFFDQGKGRDIWRDRPGSLALDLKDWEE